MLSDMFWNIATSDMAITSLAIIAVAAVIVSHVPLIRWIPTIDNYMKAASLIGYIALSLLFLFLGFRLSDERAETHKLKQDLRWSQMQLENQKATAEYRERLAQQKTAEADQLKAQVNDYETQLANRPVTSAGGSCDALDDSDLNGLRALRRRANQHKRPDPAGLRGFGGTGSVAGP